MKHDDSGRPVELWGNRDTKLILHGGKTSFRVGAWLHKADIMRGVSVAEEFGFGDGQE